jgi:mycofactocin precursor peptide MftA
MTLSPTVPRHGPQPVVGPVLGAPAVDPDRPARAEEAPLVEEVLVEEVLVEEISIDGMCGVY